ncbi:MAG: radical SAM protein [Polyangiaceae bacterium]
MKALIKVGYSCNDHCTFCHTLDVRHIDDTPENVHTKIARAHQLGHSMVVFSGGEPTMRPEIHTWAEHVVKLGLDLGFITNGRMFAYPEFTQAMLGRRLKYVYLSLHGGDARVHNRLVRAQAFEESFGGVKALHGKIETLTVNCVITPSNLPHLRAVVDLLLPFTELTIKFSMTAPKGAGDANFDLVVPPVDACAAAVKDAIEYGLSKLPAGARGPRFAHDGLPLCLLPGLEDLYDDLKTNHFRTMTEVGETDFFPVDDIIKTHPEPCDSCALKGPCPGLFRGYVERIPTSVSLLRTRRSPARANSYNLVPTRDVIRPKGAPCPLLLDGTTSYDRARSLFLRLNDRMRLYETSTRDFADSELLTTKEELGQLYVDISRKLAPDHFPSDLRKLKLLDECAACEKRPICTGCWAPMPTDVFTRDDAPIQALLSELSGDVLDIGAGDGRYLNVMAAAAKRGELRYRAVEPDAGHVSLLSTRHPWASFEIARAEDVTLAQSSLDHVLFLRSYNHLSDPERVLTRVVDALRVGGSLLLVDDVAFGLLRERSHAARAEQGPAIQEHARNDDSGRVATLIERLGLPLDLVARRDVQPSTSNQWALRYRRR